MKKLKNITAFIGWFIAVFFAVSALILSREGYNFASAIGILISGGYLYWLLFVFIKPRNLA